MPKLSAGLLLYRVRDDVVEVLIGHPGGPFWARKDDGAWSIPKGEYADGEDPWAAAQREFEEEIGLPPPAGPRIDVPTAEAAQRQGHHRVRRAGRSRPRRCAQQYLRTRMAQGIRADPGLPRGRPGRLVPGGAGQDQAAQRPPSFSGSLDGTPRRLAGLREG